MISMGVASLVSQEFALQRSYWVMLTVAIVLRPDFGSVFARALQRGIGTVVGAVAGALIIAVVPGGPWLLVPCAVLAGLLPYGQVRNWGLFSTFLTPLVVILIDLLQRAGWVLALDRLVDTLLGCAIVLLVGYAPWPSSWHAHLPAQFAAVLDSVARYTEAALLGMPGRSSLRRQTYRALSDLRTEFQRTMAEPRPASRPAARLWPAVLGVEQLMDTLIAAGVRSEVSGQRPPEADVRRRADALREMAAGGPGRPGARRPAAAGQPGPPAGGRRHRRRAARAGRRASRLRTGRYPVDWRTRARDGLVVLLTVTTGSVDAACFMHLGHVFCSVVTGTLVLLGVAAGTHDAALAESAGVALASYTAGVAIAAPLAARRAGRWLDGWPARRAHRPAVHREIWPSWLTVALALEFCVLAAFCAGWELAGGHPSRGAQLLLLILVGVGHGHPGVHRPAARRDLHDLPDRHADRGRRRAGHRAGARRAGPQPGHFRRRGRGRGRIGGHHHVRAGAAAACWC